MTRAVHFIDGKWRTNEGEKFTSLNPATGDVVWEGVEADEYIVHDAVVSAQEAFDGWAILPIEKRIDYLNAYKEQLLASNLAETISKETGKPLWEAKGELSAMANKVDISIDAYNNRCSNNKKELSNGLSITRHKPHGVVAVFGPFNFPGHLPNGHIIPALLAGNTIIFKPSELAPLVAEEMTKCWEKAKLPNGVLNMIQGGRIAGHRLSINPDIDGLFFTGSWETGKRFAEHFASFPEKILALEMGGNNPLIIHQSTDHRATAYLTIQSAYLTAGQRCTCARRLIILKGSEGDAFLQVLADSVSKIKIGPYTDRPEPFMGPVISEKVVQQLLETQSTLIAKGGMPLIKMESGPANTGLMKPGLMDVTRIVDRSDKEFFGPFLQVIRVSSFDEAIAEANNTLFGLSAGLVSNDPDAYKTFFQRIRAGIINWNTPTTGASSAQPFGGIGHSGNHRPSAYYAADYCSYPVASLEDSSVALPKDLTPGIEI